MKSLEGKTAIVTGASSGIGRAVAKLFAEEGAAVIVGARRSEQLEELVSEITERGGRAYAFAGDVRNDSCTKALVDLAVTSCGGLDIAFNNAGTLGEMGDTDGVSAEGWRETLEINLTSAFLAARHQLPELEKGGGSLIFTSSFVGYTVGMPGMAAYAASKAGLIGLMKALAAEYGPKGVRVNALLPGGTDTDMGRAFADTPEAVEVVCNLHALKRMAHPEEIAKSALYLASDASAFTTGHALLADGGVSIFRN